MRHVRSPRAVMARMARQGDILIVPIVGPVPKRATKVPREGASIVLAHGEATNHCHRIASPHATLYVHKQERYLVVERPVELVHEEHGAIGFAPGVYRVVRQREYVPESAPIQIAD
jgi:hypothetical protein